MTQNQPAAPTEAATAPLDVDGVAAVTLGTVLWAAALVVLLLVGIRFGDANGWWLWVCITGAVLGLPGMAYTRRRRAAYRAAGRSTH